MKVEVNFKMKHILKRNVDSLHHIHHHRHSRRRRLQQPPSNNNPQRNVDQLLTVKRALFVDSNLLDHHRQTSEFLKAEMDKIEEEQCARYNFDFKNELPLEGNYQWIKISTKSSPSPSSSVETKITSTSSPASSSSSSILGRRKETHRESA